MRRDDAAGSDTLPAADRRRARPAAAGHRHRRARRLVGARRHRSRRRARRCSPTSDRAASSTPSCSIIGCPGDEGTELIRADPRAAARAAPARPHRPDHRSRSRSTRCAPAPAISWSSRSRPTGCSRRSNAATDRRQRGGGELRPLSEKIGRPLGFEEIVGSAPPFRAALAVAAKAARARVSVLIEGESGSGKEIIAQAIHAASPRGKKPLHTVNCGAIPENLVESVLFGHEKGAFTGAFDRHIGRFEDADGSTLFLDEIGELPLDTQVKLLRALETGEIQRVGSRITQTVDVRIIAATNRRLADEVAAGRFREDLYYRLNVVHVPIPPLRDRASDIPRPRPPSARADRRAAGHAPSLDHRRRPRGADALRLAGQRPPAPERLVPRRRALRRQRAHRRRLPADRPARSPVGAAPTIITPSAERRVAARRPWPTAPASPSTTPTAICARSRRSRPTSSASPSAIIAAA